MRVCGIGVLVPRAMALGIVQQFAEIAAPADDQRSIVAHGQLAARGASIAHRAKATELCERGIAAALGDQ